MTDFTAPLVIVSDVHLRGPDDDRALALENLIERLTVARAGTFVLNGDIFDFCFGWRGYFAAKYRRLGEKLSALAANGTRVVFVEGNHEFAFDKMPWPGVEILARAELRLDLGNGDSVRVGHGDLLLGDFWYRLFRFLVKSRPVTFLARLFPPRWFDEWGLSYASHSRGKDAYRELDHQAVLAAARNWVEARGDKHVVFGHFHVPYAETSPRTGGRICSVESWDRPNALLFKDGSWHRAVLEAGEWRVAAAEPLWPTPERETD